MIKIHVSNTRNRVKKGNFILFIYGFKSEIVAVIAGKEINAKSIMKTPMIEKEAEIDFIIKGEDEKVASDAIYAYFMDNN